ncbi:MAG: zinc-binding dehydrogenase [Thermoproteota archaeon]|nr:zinc-binding dehydrogenase [Thermoproteota archaeon]
MGQLIDAGHIAPIVDKILPLSQASQAYVDDRSHNIHGKVVLSIAK